MNNINETIRNRVREKEQKKNAQNGLLIFFLISSFITFFMLFVSYSRNFNPLFKTHAIFIFSTISIVLASIFIHLSYSFYKKDELQKGFWFLSACNIFTLVFGVLQFFGWNILRDNYLHNKLLFNSYMIFMLISAFHFFHILGGFIYGLYLTKKHFSFFNHSKNINPIKFASYYWHFLGAIWLAIFIIF